MNTALDIRQVEYETPPILDPLAKVTYFFEFYRYNRKSTIPYNQALLIFLGEKERQDYLPKIFKRIIKKCMCKELSEEYNPQDIQKITLVKLVYFPSRKEFKHYPVFEFYPEMAYHMMQEFSFNPFTDEEMDKSHG